MAIFAAVRTEQHHTVAVAAIAVVEVPRAPRVQPDHRIDPATAVEIRPLVGKTQVCVDDASADALEIQHARITGEMPPDPLSEVGFERRRAARLDRPVLEGAVGPRRAETVSPPAHLSC